MCFKGRLFLVLRPGIFQSPIIRFILLCSHQGLAMSMMVVLALRSSTTTMSKLALVTVGVGVEISQDFYFVFFLLVILLGSQKLAIGRPS